MKYLEPSFSTFAVGSDEYRDNWDAIFKKKEDVAPTLEETREKEFEAWDARVAEVEAKASAGAYDDARMSDTYTPEEAVLHAFFNWREKLRAFIDSRVQEYESEGYVAHELRLISKMAHTGPTKVVPILHIGPGPGAAVDWSTLPARGPFAPKE